MISLAIFQKKNFGNDLISTKYFPKKGFTYKFGCGVLFMWTTSTFNNPKLSLSQMIDPDASLSFCSPLDTNKIFISKVFLSSWSSLNFFSFPKR